MKFFATAILLGLFLSGCSREDKTNSQFVGTWQHEGGFSMTLLADHSFSSIFTTSNQAVVLTYQGTWLAKDDYLISTTTNVSGIKRHEPVGSVERFKVIEVDGNHLTIKSGDQILSYKKEVTDDPVPQPAAHN